jgi:hypothetical protein
MGAESHQSQAVSGRHQSASGPVPAVTRAQVSRSSEISNGSGAHRRGASNLDPVRAAFGTFVSHAVTEFGDPSMGVVRYGIWNEPNNAAYLKMTCPDHNPLGGTTPGLYRQLYIAGYNALKAANPNAKAFVGELSELPNTGRPGCQGTKKKGLNAIDYLAAVANDAMPRSLPMAWRGTHTSIVGHRRPAVALPTRTNVVGIGRIGAIQGRIETLYDHHLLKVPTSQQYGEAPQLYFTEFGYLNRPFTRNGSTDSYHTEKERASWYPRALSLALRNHVKMFLLWETTEVAPSNATNLNAAENYPNGATAFDTGVIGTSGAVTGTRAYGKGGPQARRAYCAIRKWAKSAHYSTLASTSDDPDKC